MAILFGPRFAVAQSPGTTDLVAWWDFEEAFSSPSGPDAVNAHNPGTYDLTTRANSTSNTGIIGTAYQSTLSSDAGLTLPAADSWDDRGVSWHVTFWVYQPTTPSGFGVWCYGRRDAANGNFQQYQLFWTGPSFPPADNIAFTAWDNGFSELSIWLGAVTPGQWNFIEVGWNQTTTTLYYSINGATRTIDSSTYSGYDLSTNFQSGVNVGWAGFSQFSWPGWRIDQANHWHKILSQSEVDWLYNSGAGRQYSDL